jgi:hypothetical protein
MSRIALLGDIAHGGLLSRDPSLIPANLAGLGNLLGEFDKVVANLEFPVGTDKLDPGHAYFHYTSAEATRSIIKTLNLGILSLANNHILDLGTEGLHRTIGLLKEEGVLFTGAGYLPEHIEPLVFEVSGNQIGFMAYADNTTNPEKKKSDGLFINSLDLEKLPYEIRQLKKQVDFVILSIHWGNDYSFFPTKEQVSKAVKLVSSGVDIIMGHHPHTIQPFEKIDHAYVFYSLGQACFGDFIWEGKLRAIRKKTKKGFSPVFDKDLTICEFINFKEKKGNRVQLINRNIESWSRHKLYQTRLKHKWRLVNAFFNFREGILDRFREFLFGYYRNPLVQLFDVKTYRKGKRVSRYFQYLRKHQ